MLMLYSLHSLSITSNTALSGLGSETIVSSPIFFAQSKVLRSCFSLPVNPVTPKEIGFTSHSLHLASRACVSASLIAGPTLRLLSLDIFCPPIWGLEKTDNMRAGNTYCHLNEIRASLHNARDEVCRANHGGNDEST